MNFDDNIFGWRNIRFCYALTLDKASAKKLMAIAFKDAAKGISGLVDAPMSEIRRFLLRAAYKEHDKYVATNKPSGDSPLLKYLAGLELEERAATTAFDIVGLDIHEVASVMDADEMTVRRKLASARKSLMQNSSLAK